MGNNGEVKKETEPKITIQIITLPDGRFEMRSSLPPPMVIWIMEQIKFSLLANNLKPQESRILPVKGGVMNFARKIFRK